MQKRKKENSEKGLHWEHAVMGIKIYSKVFHEQMLFWVFIQ